MSSKLPRPTSPHLQIYKLPLTGLISITHRITGVLLSAGLVLILVFFYTISQGEIAYNGLQAVTGIWLLRFIYWGFIFAMFFHACHGVRHLLWDVGTGFDNDKLDKYARFELMVAAGLTVITWIVL